MIIPSFGSCSEIEIDLRSIITLGVQGPAFSMPRLKYYNVEPPRGIVWRPEAAFTVHKGWFRTAMMEMLNSLSVCS